MDKDGLKILKAEVQNFKNITHKVVEFNGRSAIIVAANGKGKSSLIQAITSPLNAKTIPAKPIKKGEERAQVELEVAGTVLGEYMRYTIGLYFSPKEQKGRISILNEEGAKVDGGKGFVSDLVGNIGFDMFDFLRMGRSPSGGVSVSGVRDQIEILKGLMDQDTLEALAILDQEKANAYEDRADVNRDVKSMKARLEGHDFSQEDIDTYSKKKDSDAVVKKIDAIGEEVEKWNRANNAETSYTEKIEKNNVRISEILDEVKKIELENELIEAKLVGTENWLSKNPNKPSVGALTEELNSINDHNTKCDEIAVLDKDRSLIEEKELLSQGKTDRLSEIDKEKKAIFSKNPLPVKGLEFDQEQILFKGLPLHDDQHPSSVLIGIGVRIGMAMNPNLRLLIIKDGSLLDKKTLKFVLGLCEKEGYQVLIETVDYDGESDVEVQFTESEAL
ncbi:MAG: hypothetical protein COB15_09595 [Flavobacteriales bacterium]|nr:MAG: hypothetical protein COB15_09595 [Flavobacteriales bacterium]